MEVSASCQLHRNLAAGCHSMLSASPSGVHYELRHLKPPSVVGGTKRKTWWYSGWYLCTFACGVHVRTQEPQASPWTTAKSAWRKPKPDGWEFWFPAADMRQFSMCVVCHILDNIESTSERAIARHLTVFYSALPHKYVIQHNPYEATFIVDPKMSYHTNVDKHAT